MVGLIIAQPKNPKVSKPETKIDKHEDLENLNSSVSRSEKTVSKQCNVNFSIIFLYVWAVLLMTSYAVLAYAQDNKDEQLETVALVIACILQFGPPLVPLVLLALLLISLVLWLVLSLVLWLGLSLMLCLPPWRWQEVLQLVCKEEGREEKKHLVNKKKERKEDYYSIV